MSAKTSARSTLMMEMLTLQSCYSAIATSLSRHSDLEPRYDRYSGLNLQAGGHVDSRNVTTSDQAGNAPGSNNSGDTRLTERTDLREAVQQHEMGRSCLKQKPVSSKVVQITKAAPAEEADSAYAERKEAFAGNEEQGTNEEPNPAGHDQRDVTCRYRRLLAENQQLKRRHLCRQCERKAANITLLPCGHLIYCEDCASSLTHCGICHREILADVKTFLC